MSNITSKRRIFAVWISSYGIILLISIAISGAIYLEASKLIEHEITRSNLTKLDQARQAMDNRMNDIERLSMQIALNPRILNAVRVKGAFRPNDQLNVVRSIQDLRNYMVSSGFISNLYIYLHDTNSVLSASTHIDADVFHTSIYSKKNVDYEIWKNKMLESHKNAYLILEGSDSSGRVTRSIARAQSIPIESIRNPLGTIVITLDESKFSSLMNDIEWIDKGNAFVINQNAELVASSDINFDQELINDISSYVLLNASDKAGILYTEIDGEKNVISYSFSPSTNWTYLSVIPYSVFWEKAGYLRYLAWIGALLTLLVGGISAYFLAKKNYSPIDQILKSFTSKSKVKTNSSIYEYQIIQDSISKMIDENELISKKLDEQNKTLKENFILNLLNGKVSDTGEIRQTITSLGLNFASNHFMVILLGVDDVENTDLALKLKEGSKYVKLFIKSALEDLIKKKHNIIVLDEELYVCIVNLNNSDNIANHNEIVDIIKEYRDVCKFNFDINFTAAISDVHQGIFGLTQAYREASEAMEFKVVAESDKILIYRDIKKSKCTDYFYPMEIEQKLINYIKAGDFNSSKDVLMEIFTENLSKKSFSAENAKCLMFDIVSTIMKTTEDLKDASYLEELQPVKQIMDCKSVMEMKYKLADILRKICEYVELHKTSKNSSIGEKIKLYIALHFSDPNLGVAMIGDAFDLTPSYLSKLFKDHEKESLPDYINKVRIEKAMELLMEKENSVFNIAHKVGYSNSNVFIRAFKKYQGITPGKFKEIKEIS